MEQRVELGTPDVFWSFNRGELTLESTFGWSIYLPALQTTADILSALLCIGRGPSHPMPAGAFEDLQIALEELYGEKLFSELIDRNSGCEGICLRHWLGVDDLDTYFEDVIVPPHRLLRRTGDPDGSNERDEGDEG